MNILRLLYLSCTFALAMAFAGNDLVNFIGVPLAGYEAFKQWIASGMTPEALNMAGLAGEVKTPVIFLLLSGLLWFWPCGSRKKPGL
jgi:hypothetical protein